MVDECQKLGLEHDLPQHEGGVIKSGRLKNRFFQSKMDIRLVTHSINACKTAHRADS
jgi:hypothetical protein